MLTPELVKSFIDTIKKDHSVTCWKDFAEDDKYIWAIVFGWIDEGQDKGIGVKVAYLHRNSGMSEYDIDWLMPYNETDGVDDTESFYEESENIEESIIHDIPYFNSVARRFQEEYVGNYMN